MKKHHTDNKSPKNPHLVLFGFLALLFIGSICVIVWHVSKTEVLSVQVEQPTKPAVVQLHQSEKTNHINSGVNSVVEEISFTIKPQLQ